jgi:ketosteroid isomerase-like protein
VELVPDAFVAFENGDLDRVRGLVNENVAV